MIRLPDRLCFSFALLKVKARAVILLVLLEISVADVSIVVGGGVIGLLSAYLLENAGQSVTLLDSEAVGTEASWAGGGIVSPLYP